MLTTIFKNKHFRQKISKGGCGLSITKWYTMPLVDEVHVYKGAHIHVNVNVHFPQINLSLSSSTKTHAEFFVIVTYANINMVVERQQPISKSSKTYRVLGSFIKLVIINNIDTDNKCEWKQYQCGQQVS